MVRLTFDQVGIVPLVADSMMLVASSGLISQFPIVVIKPPEGPGWDRRLPEKRVKEATMAECPDRGSEYARVEKRTDGVFMIHCGDRCTTTTSLYGDIKASVGDQGSRSRSVLLPSRLSQQSRTGLLIPRCHRISEEVTSQTHFRSIQRLTRHCLVECFTDKLRVERFSVRSLNGTVHALLLMSFSN